MPKTRIFGVDIEVAQRQYMYGEELVFGARVYVILLMRIAGTSAW